MPDIPVAGRDGGPYDPAMEERVAWLESDMREVKADLKELRASTIRIEAMLSATLPHLATKGELGDIRAALAEKPSKTYMWGILTALLTAYGLGLAGLAIIR